MPEDVAGQLGRKRNDLALVRAQVSDLESRYADEDEDGIERRVLSVLLGGLYPPERARDAAAIAAPQDFLGEKNRITYASAVGIIAGGGTPDLSAVIDELRASGRIGLAGGEDRLRWLEAANASPVDLLKNAAKLREASVRRRAIEDLSRGTKTADVVRNLAQTTQAAPVVQGRAPRVIAAPELLSMEMVEPAFVVNPLMKERGLAMVYAERGVGKTWFALAVALAAASGSFVFGTDGKANWVAAKPRRVLYCDGEMPLPYVRNRVAGLIAGSGYEPEDRFRLLSADYSDDGLPSITTAAGQALIESHLQEGDLLVLDNLSTLVSGAEENAADSWEPAQQWLLRLRRRSVSVLLVHHSGRNGQARGTSKREDVLDTVVKLARPETYLEEEGARMVVSFTKARGIYGKAASAFELDLIVKDGAMSWKTCAASDEIDQQILKAHAEGLSMSKIGDLVGLDKSTVCRRLPKAQRKAARGDS